MQRIPARWQQPSPRREPGYCRQLPRKHLLTPIIPVGSELAPLPLPYSSIQMREATSMGRKSRSARRSRELPRPDGTSSSKPAGRSRAVSTLARELADFLVEFSIVLHKRSMYPAGHPHLIDSADRFVRRMTLLLETRDSVTLGVARHRLVIDTVTTDPNNALLRDLAHRLHRHRIASVHLSRGAGLGEIESLLAALSSDPQRGEGPLGKRLDRLGPWSHIRLQPVGYERFELRHT